MPTTGGAVSLSAAKVLQWALDEAACPLAGGPGAAPVAVMFWISIDGTGRLPDTFVRGTRSAIGMGFDVHLLAYSNLQNVPEGVEVHDANRWLRFDTAQKYLRHVAPALLSDLVRAKAIASGAFGDAWLVDGDTVWLRRPPTNKTLAAFGHFFGSMEARRGMQGKSRREVELIWSVAYLRSPSDFLYISTPCRFPRGSPVLAEWVAELETAYAKRSGKVDYHLPLQALTHIVHRWGLDWGVNIANPISRFSDPLGASQSWDPSVLKDSICVNSFWQTFAKSGKSAVDIGSHKRVPDGSVWACVLQYAADAAAKLNEGGRKRITKKGQGPNTKKVRTIVGGLPPTVGCLPPY